jgi:anti-anti-sigma factor
MNFKIDTKEKFQVICLLEESLSVNMADDLKELFERCRQATTKNVIVNMAKVQQVSEAAAETIVKLQTEFYDAGHSFVLCSVQKSVEDNFEKAGYLELLNITPTESEAWDIVQMEEIEREFLTGDDFPNEN